MPLPTMTSTFTDWKNTFPNLTFGNPGQSLNQGIILLVIKNDPSEK